MSDTTQSILSENLYMDISAGGEIRGVSTNATAYRLAKKPDGELVLQGYFARYRWPDITGGVWHDLPTAEIE